MQATDKSKQKVKTLESYYRPLGMRAVLAAAMMIKAGKGLRTATAKAR